MIFCFFPVVCVVIPLLGAFLGVGGVSTIILFTKIWRFFAHGGIPIVSTGIPTLCAAWCWSLEKRRHCGVAAWGLNVFVPLICFLLFILHPSVGYGWWYGLYWFIPVSLYGAQVAGLLRKTVFFTALRSTFLAHAVGSVIWCYAVPMAPERWLALIPLVAIERLVIASGMVVLFKFATSSFWSSIILLRVGSFLRNGEKCWYATFGHDYGWQPSVGKGKKIASGNTWSSQRT